MKFSTTKFLEICFIASIFDRGDDNNDAFTTESNYGEKELAKYLEMKEYSYQGN